MSIRPIRFFPDPVLTNACRRVEDFDRRLSTLVEDLFDTMRASPGVGIAAPQIGLSVSVSVIDVERVIRNRKLPGSCHGPVAIVNPRLLAGRGTQTPREGCLSVPDLLGNVTRFAEVDVTFFDVRGVAQELTASGFEALAFQHEIDHLNGLLFLDRVTNLKTDLFRRKSST